MFLDNHIYLGLAGEERVCLPLNMANPEPETLHQLYAVDAV